MAQPIEYVTPPPSVPQRRSGLGLASLGLGLAVIAVYAALFWSVPQDISEPFVAAMIAAIYILPGAGLTFGIVAVRQPNRRRGAAIAGLTLNALLLAYILLNVVALIL